MHARFAPALVVTLAAALTTAAAAENAMSLDFSWAGIPGCGGSRSPAFVVRNAPSQTRRLLLTLHDGSRELGGQEIPYPSSGEISAGAVYTNGPCNPGDYRWDAQALAGDGRILGTASKVRSFP